jgi:NAD(P)-dependent dehydrogenase (short-subunit alcohol dehydrogenase family)
MARIFITGSADGLGQLAAQSLISQGHKVVLHARNEKRLLEAMNKVPEGENILIADLSNIEEIIQLAAKVNDLGPFDAVIHNAGVYNSSGKEIFTVNSLAPYILTCLIEKPKRLVYISSDMHMYGHANLKNKSDINQTSYSDSKLFVLMLCKAVARKWQHIHANAVHPGWIPTKMGGKGAPDDLQKGFETQVWLAVSDDAKAQVSGHYFFHKKEKPCNPEADDVALQENFLSVCKEITGVAFPE